MDNGLYSSITKILLKYNIFKLFLNNIQENILTAHKHKKTFGKTSGENNDTFPWNYLK